MTGKDDRREETESTSGDERRLPRRAALTAVGAGLTLGTAGCTVGPFGSDTDNSTAMPPDPVDGSWPVAHYDSHNSRQTPVRGPTTEPELAWELTGGCLGCPWPVDGVVYTLDAESEEWVAADAVDGRVIGEPPLAGSRRQRYYLGIGESRAYASVGTADMAVFDTETGERIGVATLDQPPIGWATITDSGILAPIRSGASLASVDRSGTVRWQVEQFGSRFEHPVVVGDTVIAVSSDIAVALDRETGEQRWAIAFDRPASPPAVVVDDEIVIAHEDGTVQALGTDGTRLWRRTPLEGAPDTMAVDGDTVFVPATDGIVTVRAGPEIERLPSAEQIAPVSRLSLGRDRLYAVHGESSRKVSALDTDGGGRKWTYDVGSGVDGRVSVLDGPRIIAGRVLCTVSVAEDDQIERVVALSEP